MKRERIVLSVAAAAVLVLSGCSSKSGDDTPSDGNFTIEMNGGDGGVEGASSSRMDITSYGANIRIEKTGTVDTDFTVPANTHETDLGDYGAIFTGDTHVPLLLTGEGPVYGTYYTTSSKMYKSDGDTEVGDEDPVTGIQVNEGVTLTLGLNSSYGDTNGDDTASYSFANDVVINGTLKTDDLTQTHSPIDLRYGVEATTRDKGALRIYLSGAFIVGAGGKVDTSGDDAGLGSDERGGDGGAIVISLMDSSPTRIEGSIEASGGNGDGDENGGRGAVESSGSTFINILADEGGSFVHTGSSTIDGSGGDGYGGGYGANIVIDTDYDFYNTGKIDASAGDARVAGSSQDAGDVSMTTTYGNLYNSGDIFAKGGDNDISSGGSGGKVNLYVESRDELAVNLYNSGEINVNGGDSISSSGGSAGSINFDLDVSGGDLRSSGNLYANGGEGSQNGGSGGSIYIEYGKYENDVAGNMFITGNLHNNGGIAQEGDGGTGGSITFRHLSQAVGTHTLSLLGYTAINVSGGDGADAGGIGGDVSVAMYEYGNKTSYYNEVDIYGHGGDATSDGQGGNGGSFRQYADPESGDVQNSGSLYFNGGSSIGMVNNSNGGSVKLDDYGHADSVTNTADIITVAAGIGGSGADGNNGIIEISDVDVTPADGTLP